MPSNIEWCDETINPIVGCSEISPACTACYAKKMAWRLAHIKHTKERYAGVVDKSGWTGKLNFVPSELEKPATWKKPRRIFVGSMTDIFHENAKYEWFEQIMDYAEASDHHKYLFLTKREDRMKLFFDRYYDEIGNSGAPKGVYTVEEHIIPGVTAENQPMYDKRVPVLLRIPAAVHFVSIEPMLADMDITDKIDLPPDMPTDIIWGLSHPTIGPDWVICGPENGTNARHFELDWARSIKDQCIDADTPFFFKVGNGELDGKIWREFPR